MIQLPVPALGSITAISITTPHFQTSLDFYRMLGFHEVARATWPFPWVQVSDGALLIMLRQDNTPALALTYFTATYSKVIKMLDEQGIELSERSGDTDTVKRCSLLSPDGITIRVVGITDGFSQPPGPGMLQMPQEDYSDPSKYANKTIGMFGELAHPVADLQASIAFWGKLGFTTISEFSTPYPWAVITDGINAVGLHQTTHFQQPALTFFASDMRHKIDALKHAGLQHYTHRGPANVIIDTPEQQQIFLFQMGEEKEFSAPRLSDIAHAVLKTPRLLLKEITPGIMHQLFSRFSDEDIMTYLCITDPAMLAAERSNYELGLEWYRATYKGFIICSRANGRRMGLIGYHTWYTRHSRAEIGYHLDNDADKNKGYMTEALSAVLSFGFEEMGLNRVEAFLSPANTPSVRLLKHFGFVEEGLLRQHYCKDGVVEDSLCCSLLRSEYMK